MHLWLFVASHLYHPYQYVGRLVGHAGCMLAQPHDEIGTSFAHLTPGSA